MVCVVEQGWKLNSAGLAVLQETELTPWDRPINLKLVVLKPAVTNTEIINKIKYK